MASETQHASGTRKPMIADDVVIAFEEQYLAALYPDRRDFALSPPGNAHFEAYRAGLASALIAYHRSRTYTQEEVEAVRNAVPEALRRIVADLEEVRKAVFGGVGDEPDVYADYDELCRLSGLMCKSLSALEERALSAQQARDAALEEAAKVAVAYSAPTTARAILDLKSASPSEPIPDQKDRP